MKSVEQIRKLEAEISVVQRSAAIAVENIKQHVGNLRPKFEESKTWADGVLKDQSFLLTGWRPVLDKFISIPVFEELGRCLHGAQMNARDSTMKEEYKMDSTLRDFVDLSEMENYNKVGESISQRFRASISSITTTFDDVGNGSQEVIESFGQTVNLSNSDPVEYVGRLMEEIEVVAKKVDADYEYVLGLQNTQKTISQVSRIALLHTKNFLPTLSRTHSEIKQLLYDTAEKKDNTILSAVRYMQKISILESKVAQVHAQLATLDTDIEDGEAFDFLNLLMRLPAVYGSLLIECVRRREWNQKITTDSSSLVEEMATFKEEEVRRRKKWLKDMGGTVDLELIDDMILGVEVNIQTQKQKWPNTSRQDVRKFLKILKDLGPFEDIHQELEDLAKTLDAPTKSQVRRAKAFKNGSIHEATFGRNSLLLRGDDDLLQSMKSEKSRLEERLKSSESRIRKLEDLLHRQSQIHKPSNGNTFGINNGPIFERHATSPFINYTSSLSKPHEIPSRRSSTSSRRISMNNDMEEKGLVQRILTLEAELGAEKEQTINLQKDAEAKTNAEDNLKLRVQEALSTKDDLMENLEAQQREFDAERRLLENENSKLKLKLEEVEDELDGVLENRDHENKIRDLEKELENARRDAAGEKQKAKEQIDIARDDYTRMLENANGLKSQLDERGSENTELTLKYNEMSTQLQNRDQAQAEHHRGLRATLLQLSKDDSAPEDLGALVDLIEALAEKSASYLRDVQKTLESVRAENAALEVRATERSEEIYDLTERLGIEEMEVFSVRENLAEQKSKLNTLQANLDHERNESAKSQSRLVIEEQTSESLQLQLHEKEGDVLKTTDEIYDCMKRIQFLEGVVEERQAQITVLKNVRETLDQHAEARACRTEEVSQRLHFQNMALGQLLEQIGLVVTEQDNVMVIHKIPRVANASMMLSDPSMSMNRSLSAPLPVKSIFDSFPDDSILQWAKATDPDLEASKFKYYMESIKKFDVDIFSEAVIKRVKEAEHTARKWQREARAYREKSHRAQGEAHEKIAFRSFKEGDLALFLPTRNQATRPWAAFNVGAPHFFLREQDSHRLRTRDWLLARISRVEERVVDLSKSINGLNHASDRRSIGDASDGGASFDDENPFELSDGLRWYLLDAAEEKPGAPINVGLGKVTVASANVDAKGSIRMKKSLDGNGATKTLTRSLDSRRSSSNSKKGLVAVTAGTPLVAAELGETLSMEPPNGGLLEDANPIEPQPINLPSRPTDEVRNQDLLWGP